MKKTTDWKISEEKELES